MSYLRVIANTVRIFPNDQQFLANKDTAVLYKVILVIDDTVPGWQKFHLFTCIIVNL